MGTIAGEGEYIMQQGEFPSKPSAVELSRGAKKKQQFEIILINSIPVKGDNWDTSGPAC